MARQEHIENLNGRKLLESISTAARRLEKADPYTLFASPKLSNISTVLREQYSHAEESRYPDWRNLKRCSVIDTTTVTIGITYDDYITFRDKLQSFEKACKLSLLIKRNECLEELLLLGQEILRRQYLAMMMYPHHSIILTKEANLFIETGETAIQTLGAAPAGPKQRFVSFNSHTIPSPDLLGIEILSSGSFPDWSKPAFAALKQHVAVCGFEKVVRAAFDTPRSRMIARAVQEGKNVYPLSLPKFNRVMLDLELMRLGQATTPGTFTMLLNSFYNGALMVDHSTNVSEQVQIIFEEEHWRPVCTIDPAKDIARQANEIGEVLLTTYFRTRDRSPIGRDHPREARIEFSAQTESSVVVAFFQSLQRYLNTNHVIQKKSYAKRAKVHTILPVLRVSIQEDGFSAVKNAIRTVRSAGFKELAVMSEYSRHCPGLLQYFSSAKETNEILTFARSNNVILRDGRTIDTVATANKAIEATAGAIASGQGCIKVGLLGLTLEQMELFVKNVSSGLDAKHKRKENQLLVFIGLVDEPIVSEHQVYKDAPSIAHEFVELMKRTGQKILLLDTMHKGEHDPRLVDAGDDKKGHLTASQLRSIVRRAKQCRCDLWVAGSYTEEQVYKAALEAPADRVSLICLGGAERNFGGLRLDPSEAYNPEFNVKKPSLEERILSARIEYDSDIKFILSRENKLARDAGHVTGHLLRAKAPVGKKLKLLRKQYLENRNSYFSKLEEYATNLVLPTRNIDTLYFQKETQFKKLSPKEKSTLDRIHASYEKIRERYVSMVSDQMYELFGETWFPRMAEDRKADVKA